MQGAKVFRMLRYTSFQNWTIGQLLIGLGHRAEPIRGSIPSAWITDASEAEIRDAAALSGVVQLEIQPVREKESPAEIRRTVDQILQENKPQRQRR
jgi:hypothetical protein